MGQFKKNQLCYHRRQSWQTKAILSSVALLLMVVITISVSAAGSTKVDGWENNEDFAALFESITHTPTGTKSGVTLSGNVFTLTANDGNDGCKSQGGSVTLYLVPNKNVIVTCNVSSGVSANIPTGSEQAIAKGSEISFTLGETSDKGSQGTVTITVKENEAAYPENTGLPKHATFMIKGGDSYHYLDEAINAANSGDIIIVTGSGTAYPSDWQTRDSNAKVTFTIPKGVKLLVPYDGTFVEDFDAEPTVTHMTEVKPDLLTRTITLNLVSTDKTVTYAFTNLIIPKNTTLEIAGELNVNSGVFVSTLTDTGCPNGSYGQITLADATSNLVINSGGILYCYGYITGTFDANKQYCGGTVTARSGSTVYELFQIRDWRGGNIIQDYSALSFIISQYYMQNIEARYAFQTGASHKLALAFFLLNNPVLTSFEFMGVDSGLIRLSSGEILRTYDPVTERITYDIQSNSELALDSLAMEISGTPVDSASYILGFNQNMSFVIRSGSSVTISQRLKILPGMQLKIEEGASATILPYNEEQGTNGAVYIYDSAHWNAGYTNWAPEENTKQQHNQSIDVAGMTIGYLIIRNYDNDNTKKDVVRYSPSRRAVYGEDVAVTSPQNWKSSAKVIVDGSLIMSGNVYTTSGFTTNGTSYSTPASADRIITGTGTIINRATYSQNADVNIGYGELDECYSNSTSKIYKIPCLPVVGLLAGVSTSTSDVNDSFGVGTYYGLGANYNNYWYQYRVIVNGGLVDVTSGTETGNAAGVVAYVANSTTTNGSVSFVVTNLTNCSHLQVTASSTATLSDAYKLTGFTGDCTVTINHTIGENGLCTGCNVFPFYGSNIRLGNNLDMMFAFPKAGIAKPEGHYVRAVRTYADGSSEVIIFKYGATSAVITRTKADGTTETEYVYCGENTWKSSNETYYYVTYNGFAAKQMCDTIALTVHQADGTVVSAVWVDSIQNYAMRMLSKYESTKPTLRTLLVDMLNYGAACQDHFNYAEDNLANSKLTAAQQAYATDKVVTAPTDDMKDSRDKTYWNGANMIADSDSQFVVGFTDKFKEGMYFTYEFTNHWEKTIVKKVYCNQTDMTSFEGLYHGLVNLRLADARIDITFKVYDASGNKVSEWTDSIARYVARMSTNEDDVYMALLKFADAANAYLHSEEVIK